MNVLIAILAGLIVANAYVYQAVFASPMLEVRVLEVGKSTVALVRSPDGKTLLIDTGSDASILRALGLALPMWQRHVDALILTSSDGASTGGLKSMRGRYLTPAPVQFGTGIPYGASVTFNAHTQIAVIAPHIFTISYGATSFVVSSTTQAGTYRSDGNRSGLP